MFLRLFLLLIFCLCHLNGAVSSNPFLRPGSNQKPLPAKINSAPKPVIQSTIQKELEFKGYFILNGQPFFSIINKKVNHSEWISLSEKTYEEFQANSFDLETETLTILYEGQTFDLKLIDAKTSPSFSSPLPKSPVAPNRIVGAGKVSKSKIMPPKPKFIPTLPSNIGSSSSTSSTSRPVSGYSSNTSNFNRGNAALSLPGLPYPGAVPRRSIPSDSINSTPTIQPNRGITKNYNGRNPGSLSTISDTVLNNTVEREEEKSSKSENSFDLQNLPPPPPPPNILPPSPPPDIQPSRE